METVGQSLIGNAFTACCARLDLVSNEFDSQLTRVYPRAIGVEDKTGLRPCYDLSAAGSNISSLRT